MSLRERKKAQTAQKIAATALRLFAERGFDQVTISEIADAAEVARGTLFSYFPTKESLVLASVGDDDPASIVAGRPPGVSAVEALRDHYRRFALDPGVDANTDLLAALRVISNSSTLSSAVNRLYDSQRDALAEVLAQESDDEKEQLTSRVAAAQICATILALKADFFAHLASGMAPARALKDLPAGVDRAFGLLEQGIGGLYRRPLKRNQK